MLTFGRLSRKHDRVNFSCGNEALDDYLKRRASQEIKCGDAACYVVTEDDGTEILGFCTLSCLSVDSQALRSLKVSKFFYQEAGFFLLGRLAVSKNRQHSGIGSVLVNEAIKLTAESPAGTHGLIVDLKEEELVKFYSKFGFLSFPNNKLRMFLIAHT